MAHRALHLGVLFALLAAALITAPVALSQPAPDPAPAAPAPAPDPAPVAAAPPATPPAAPPPVAPAPAAPVPESSAPAAPAVEEQIPRPAPPSEPAAGAKRERPEPARTPRGPDAGRADRSVANAAFLRVESLLPRGDPGEDSPNTLLLLAAGALLALVIASGSFVSVLARLMPPAAILLVLLAAPATAQAGTITPNCDTPGGARDGCSRWYTSSKVSLTWSVEPSGGEHVSGCQVTSFTLETAPLYRECRWSWSGSVFTATVWIAIDRTPPQLTSLQMGRPPDHGDWFNHPVSVKFKGADALSGIDSCSDATYSGPDGAGVPVAGSCTDVAGNVGAGSLPLNYDATAPAAPAVAATPRDRGVQVEWTPAADAVAEVTRFNSGASTTVYRGSGDRFTDTGLKNEERYRYVVALVDQAGNRSSGEAGAVPTASPLLTPSARAKLTRPPLLTWRRVRRASYYNVQLFRGSRKVLSRWPRTNELQLTRRWRFAGKPRRLAAGRYCWYVWPGFGPRRERDYGRLLGKRCFTVTRA